MLEAWCCLKLIKHSIVIHAMEKCLCGGTLRMRTSCSELNCMILLSPFLSEPRRLYWNLGIATSRRPYCLSQQFPVDVDTLISMIMEFSDVFSCTFVGSWLSASLGCFDGLSWRGTRGKAAGRLNVSVSRWY